MAEHFHFLSLHVDGSPVTTSQALAQWRPPSTPPLVLKQALGPKAPGPGIDEQHAHCRQHRSPNRATCARVLQRPRGEI